MSERATILVVEDEPLLRDYMRDLLDAGGYEVLCGSSMPEGRDLVDRHTIDMAFLDISLAGDSSATPSRQRGGFRLLSILQERAPGVPVVFVTDDTSAETAVDLMHQGAFHYLNKPVEREVLLNLAAMGVELSRSRRQLEALGDMRRRATPAWHVGPTPKMKEAERLVALFAPTPASILIQGETGTGKDVVANAIHQASDRAAGPFVALNCGALPEALLESELFGHEKGAFTGAAVTKKGMFEIADGGTLFLDELTTMAAGTQAKLLRALQDYKIRRVGGTTDIKVDVRVISATNRDIREAMDNEEFRADLYYRICVEEIHLPPLRERAVDIPYFALLFVEEQRERMGSPVEGLTERALLALSRWSWPGNVRELRNVIERAVVMARGEERVDVCHLPSDIAAAAEGAALLVGEAPAAGANGLGAETAEAAVQPGRLAEDLPVEGMDLIALRDAWEKRMMEQALARTDGNQAAAARLLYLSRDQFRNRAAKFGL